MRKYNTVIVAAIVVLALALSLGSRAGVQGSGDSDSGTQPGSLVKVIIPDRYQASQGEGISDPNGTVETVYFTPQDEDTSTTVLFVYNTSDTAATVGLQTFTLDGALYIDTTIQVPANNLVRICGDPVDTFSATWWDVVLVNFRTYSAYAKMTLPAGIKVEGYVVWNDGSTYDPRIAAPTLNLRFSSELVSVPTPPVEQNVIELTDATFDEIVVGSDVPVLVFFYATWCPYSNMMDPIIQEIADEYVGRAKICKLNIDGAPDITARFDVTAVPTFILFKDGQVQGKWIGVTIKEELTAAIDELL